MREIAIRPPLKCCAVVYTLVVACTVIPVTKASADGKADGGGAVNPTTRQNDQRLPPVLPGEEIVTETGQKMRVWSSSGPVPVNPQPTPQPLPSGFGGAGVGVIVDGRVHPGHQGGQQPPLDRGPLGR